MLYLDITFTVQLLLEVNKNKDSWQDMIISYKSEFYQYILYISFIM